ncbi:hypothetical protein ACS0X5_24885 [Burkholderia gladioli]|uniref:Uncharacterized protein n=1 Tax=Burkholderia gladioli (strain BSR3) TaxID=999541 RepID=F2LRL4_BURGS|nr:hypothetical protein [Burkholderia gladioli]AEA65508.1 hypothetical protein bgla_1p1110 [Burkholderia gladioli BSR3]MBW5288063.1 hypothetical protein [Burkholderia gladioli]
MSVFRPMREPARSIHDALLREAAKRKNRTIDEWLAQERAAVWKEAIGQAQKLQLRAPSMADIERAERHAIGHTDYAAKWAHGVADAMST